MTEKQMIEKYFVTHTCHSFCAEGIGIQKDGIEYEELSHQDIADLLNEQDKRIKELEYENRLLKITYAKCCDCKHADLYIPSYTYPFFNPKCRLTGDNIQHDQNGCGDFKLIGRLGR